MSKQHRADQPRADLERPKLDETKPAKAFDEGNAAPGKHKRGKQG